MVNIPKVPEPKFIIENAGRFYKDRDSAEKDYEKYYELDMSVYEKLYLNTYKTVAVDLAGEMDDLDKEYEEGKKDIEEQRREQIKKARDIRDQDISEITKSSESIVAVLERAIPAGLIYLGAKSSIPSKGFGYWAEAIGFGGIIGFHYLFNKFGKSRKDKIKGKYWEEVQEIRNDCLETRKELNIEFDKRKRKKCSRAEEKLMGIYEKYFGIKIKGTSADEYFRKFDASLPEIIRELGISDGRYLNKGK